MRIDRYGVVQSGVCTAPRALSALHSPHLSDRYGAGVCGAALADLGFPVETLRGFALLARTAGLLGHLAEEQRRPIGPAVYADVDRSTDYRADS